MTKILLAVLFGFCALSASAAPQAAGGGKMELFLETMDGQGWQWFFLSDMVRRRLDGAELKVWPVVSKDAKGAFTAKRGDVELAEARRLAVVLRAYPAKALTYLNARSLNPTTDGWKDAAVFAGINPDELTKKTAAEGDAALEAALARSKAAGVDATALLLDGKPYEGSQRLMPLYDAVNAALPAGKRAAPPAGYKAPPKPVPPGLWVVLGSGMKKSDALIGVFDRYFEGIKPVVLDEAAPERLAKFPWLEFVPAYVLTATPEARSALENEIKAGLFKENSGYLVYEDRQHRGVYASRPAAENKLELFVMSQCPYGVLAVNSVFGAEKEKLLPPGLKIEVHFIGDTKKNEKGELEFNSLHGDAEWQEDARQLYIAGKFPDKFGAYVLERNKEITSPDWQKAAKAAGVDVDAVAAGFEASKVMLAQDFALSAQLGISTSPSFVLNGREFMVGAGELKKSPGFEKLPEPGQAAGGCNGK